MVNHKLVHGDDLLYQFLLHLLAQDSERYSEIPRLLLVEMGVWFPLTVYERVPVLLPWVVRDPTCRGSRTHGSPDEWSSPNSRGFSRDDNSLVKGLPRSLRMTGPKGSKVNGRRMGSEFVAAHIWRHTAVSGLASRHPLLNSFVPNLVWLPSQIAKLTDREGGVVQQTLQSLSWQIYRTAPVADHLTDVVDEAWSLLPEPTVTTPPVDPGQLNWFVAANPFFQIRQTRIQQVAEALDRLESELPLDKKVVTTRYTAGLPNVAPDQRKRLRAHLARFQRSAIDPNPS